MKQLSAILFFSFLHIFIFAQDTGSLQKLQDSTISHKPSDSNVIPVSKDSIVKAQVKRIPVKKDSAALVLINKNIADSLRIDSLQIDSLKRDSLKSANIKIAAASKKGFNCE